MIAIRRHIFASVVVLAAIAPPASGQKPKPIEPTRPAVAGAAIDARHPLVTVPAPAALSRDELARRLKKLDGSLPNALPVGTPVILTPGRLQYGRTHLGMYGVQRVRLNAHGVPVAMYTEVQDESTEGIFIEFDAAGPSIYGLDLALAGNDGPALGGAFDIAIWGLGYGTDIRASPASDGHVVASFSVPRAGRYTINIERQRGVDSGYWYFFRAELQRVQ